MFKQASKLKIRFQTSIGELSTEQLWDLSLEKLDSLAVSLQEEYKESGKKSFLEKKTAKDKELKLRFDIVLHILTSKVEEMEAEKENNEVKSHNAKIDALIAEKQDEELKSKSIKDLEKLRK